MTEIIRVLELYSGIGGMHCALQDSGIKYEVVAAIDVNTTANKIYRHNFKGTYLIENGIEKLTVTQIDRMKIDMILMSPPCQPFTRVGKKLDIDDLRTKSFLHLLDLLPQLTHCPSYILVENVKGFEESQTRDLLIKALQKCQFHLQEFMLTPLQFGIPNSRLRYYMIAKRLPVNPNYSWSNTEQLCYSVPSVVQPYLRYKILCDTEKRCYHTDKGANPDMILMLTSKKEETKSLSQSSDCETVSESKLDECTGCTKNKCEEEDWMFVNHNDGEGDSSKTNQGPVLAKRLKTKHSCDKEKHSNEDDLKPLCCMCDNESRLMEESQLLRQDEDTETYHGKCLQLQHFLEKQSAEYFNKYKLPDKDLKRFIVMDVVFPCIRKTICFTKRYGHYMEGAGSIIQMSTEAEDVTGACQLKKEAVEKKNNKNWGEKEIAIIRKLQLRYFTPREIANLLCFPETFDFPDNVSTIQKNRVLGNSLNVHVVSVLIRLLTMK
ncbi:tRNA (cytosine(38)-C(5))-methyltransferase-like [Mytilus edulis]|uniref:tRNA (cytosine(38)-C(5))-methyltransferase-like n=1 Tax=Mytilus edulis TaxID=6550 RepID=UPI0039F0B699